MYRVPDDILRLGRVHGASGIVARSRGCPGTPPAGLLSRRPGGAGGGRGQGVQPGHDDVDAALEVVGVLVLAHPRHRDQWGERGRPGAGVGVDQHRPGARLRAGVGVLASIAAASGGAALAGYRWGYLAAAAFAATAALIGTRVPRELGREAAGARREDRPAA